MHTGFPTTVRLRFFCKMRLNVLPAAANFASIPIRPIWLVDLVGCGRDLEPKCWSGEADFVREVYSKFHLHWEKNKHTYIIN
jgi:hypothetical protein